MGLFEALYTFCGYNEIMRVEFLVAIKLFLTEPWPFKLSHLVLH